MDALPVLINSSAMRLARSTGIAKPDRSSRSAHDAESAPSVAMAEPDLTSRAFVVTSAPPELPGADRGVGPEWRPARCSGCRPRRSSTLTVEKVLTIPVVTVPSGQTERRPDRQHRLTDPQVRGGTQGDQEPGDALNTDDHDITGGAAPPPP